MRGYLWTPQQATEPACSHQPGNARSRRRPDAGDQADGRRSARRDKPAPDCRLRPHIEGRMAEHSAGAVAQGHGVLMNVYTLRLQRALCERLTLDLLVRWFLDMRPDEPCCSHSRLLTYRSRRRSGVLNGGPHASHRVMARRFPWTRPGRRRTGLPANGVESLRDAVEL